MEPSVQFLKKIAGKPEMLKLVDRFQKEFNIYQYLSDYIPKKFTDKDWDKMLETKSVEDRVLLWNFISLTQKRDEADVAKKEAERKKIVDQYIEQEAIYNKGGMGYGPGYYRMFLDPFAQMKQRVEDIYDVKQYISDKLRDQPTLALDLQYVEKEIYAKRSRLNNNLRFLMTHNRTSLYSPFPLTFINTDIKIPAVKIFMDNLGYFQRESMPSSFLPPIHKGNPFIDAKNKRDIVYISRFARDMLDGPLIHNTYIIPITFDDKRESLGAARSGNFRPMTLPFKKYVQWKSGQMVLPLTNIQKTLDTVSRTGGDWHRALHENISHRHLISHEENRNDKSPHKELKKFRREENKQVVSAIKEVLGES